MKHIYLLILFLVPATATSGTTIYSPSSMYTYSNFGYDYPVQGTIWETLSVPIPTFSVTSATAYFIFQDDEDDPISRMRTTVTQETGYADLSKGIWAWKDDTTESMSTRTINNIRDVTHYYSEEHESVEVRLDGWDVGSSAPPSLVPSTHIYDPYIATTDYSEEQYCDAQIIDILGGCKDSDTRYIYVNHWVRNVDITSVQSKESFGIALDLFDTNPVTKNRLYDDLLLDNSIDIMLKITGDLQLLQAGVLVSTKPNAGVVFNFKPRGLSSSVTVLDRDSNQPLAGSTNIPEPTPLALLVAGVLGFGYVRKNGFTRN